MDTEKYIWRLMKNRFRYVCSSTGSKNRRLSGPCAIFFGQIPSKTSATRRTPNTFLTIACEAARTFIGESITLYMGFWKTKNEINEAYIFTWKLAN